MSCLRKQQRKFTLIKTRMETKKKSSVDLEQKRIAFFQIGLLVTGAFTLAAFAYKTPIETAIRKEKVAFQEVVFIEETAKEIPKKIEEPKEPVHREAQTTLPTVVAAPALSTAIVTQSNTSVNPTTGVTVGTGNLQLGDLNDMGGIVEVDIEIVDIPTKDAAFNGGYAALNAYILQHLNFPQDAIDLNMQGKVFVSFVVEKDGSVSNVQIERGVYHSLDLEAKRLVRSFPTWIPGEMPHGKVRTRVRLPINFILE
jgi:protein TonB